VERPESNAFENVKDQIGSCGIWCGSCIVGNGALMELTERYQKLIAGYGLKNWGPEDFDFEEFSKGLASIGGIRACSGCLKGGGRDECEIRSCALERNLNDCTACDGRPACKHGEILEHMRSGARAAGLFVRDTGSDRSGLLARWAVELTSKWPSCVLFVKNDAD